MRKGPTYGLGAALLAAGAAVLLVFREHASLELGLLALICAGTAAISFAVGYVLGHFADRGDGPGPGGSG